MEYRKFRADQLFNGYEMLGNDQVLITSAEGIIDAVVPASEAGDDVQLLQGILSPGFINCHCHLELSHMKGLIAEGTGLIDFLYSVVSKRQVGLEMFHDAVEMAETEMINNGIVAVGDICNTTSTIGQKSRGRIQYHNFIETFGFDPATVNERFQQSVDIHNEYSRHFGANSIVPHAPYSVADELWNKIIRFPGNHLLTIHNQETPAENELFLTGTGDFVRLYEKMGTDISFFTHPVKTSFQSYLNRFSDEQSVILVHNVCTSEDDIAFANDSGKNLYWCFCPNANQYISRQLPAIDRFAANTDQLVLGTDSLASNHSLDILSEIKLIRKSCSGINIHQLFRWATSNGAKALQMDDLLGSFEKGKKPGVILIDNELAAVKRLL